MNLAIGKRLKSKPRAADHPVIAVALIGADLSQIDVDLLAQLAIGEIAEIDSDFTVYLFGHADC